MSKPSDSGKTDAGAASNVDQYIVKDPERFALNVAPWSSSRQGGLAWAEPREKGEVRDSLSEPMTDMVKTFSKLTEYWLCRPAAGLEAQTRLFSGYMSSGRTRSRRVGGETTADAISPGARRQALSQDPEWGLKTPSFRLPQAGLSRHVQMGGRSRRTRRRSRPAHAPQGRLLRQADRQRDIAFQLHPDQSGTLPRDGGQQRRENLVRG